MCVCIGEESDREFMPRKIEARQRGKAVSLARVRRSLFSRNRARARDGKGKEEIEEEESCKIFISSRSHTVYTLCIKSECCVVHLSRVCALWHLHAHIHANARGYTLNYKQRR